MDVALTAEQELLRTAAREFLEAECPMPFVRAHVDPPEATASDLDGQGTEGGPGTSGAAWRTLWDKMTTLGWLGLAIPESYGGAGLGVIELAVVLEEMGRALLPAPFLSSAVLGGQLVVIAGSDAQKRELLPRIADGALRISVAQCEADGSWDPAAVRLAAKTTPTGYALTGSKRFVWDAGRAHLLAVSARTSDGPTLFLLERDAPGMATRRIEFVDRTRPVYEVVLDGVEVARHAILGTPGKAVAVLDALNDLARVGLAAEACGGAAWALDASVAYANSREQFGAPIGSFQAIAHKCADMLVKVESARSAAYYAAWSLGAREHDAHVSACMAKAYCADAFAEVAAAAIQVHGGLGFTWEQDVHLYYKRAVATQLALGDSAFTRELAARVLIDGERAAHA